MKEFSDAIKATLYERATSPLYSTFVFSWLIWNWKIPMVILFGDKQSTRIDYIDNYVDSFEIPLLTLLIWPLVSAIFLLLLLPYFSNWIYKIALKFKQKRLDFKTKSESSSILSAEKALELYKELSEIKGQLAAEMAEKKLQVTDVNQENQSLKEEVSNQTRVIGELKIEMQSSLASKTSLLTDQGKLNSRLGHFENIIIHNFGRDSHQIAVLQLIKKYDLQEIVINFNKIQASTMEKNDKMNLQIDLLHLKLLSFVSNQNSPNTSFCEFNEKGKKAMELIHYLDRN
jgi:hypothetical protein